MIDYPPGLPCWAPGAADYLAELLTGEEVAIEWGGGASSVWLAPKVFRLHTYEHNPHWADRLSGELGDVGNFTLHEHPFSSPDYVNALANMDRAPVPHVWLIDGYRRIDCLEFVTRKSQRGDLVVCDDALDYAEECLELWDIKRFAMPHPYAGTPIDQKRHAGHGNTNRTHHAMTKETWIWRV